MLYSFMNVNSDYYVHLHGELILREAKDGCCTGGGHRILTAGYGLDVVREIGEEKLENERILIDFTDIDGMTETVVSALCRVLADMKESHNEVYLLKMSRQMKDELCTGLRKAGIAPLEKTNRQDEWYCEIPVNNDQDGLTIEECEKLKTEIQRDNLLILMDDAPTGKAFDIKRLLEDREYCIFYYIYQLAVKMAREGLVSYDPSQNGDLCLVPDNSSGEYICRELHIVLGAGVRTEEDLKTKVEPGKKYYIVRDVIHMFCELNRLGTVLAQDGESITGSLCLLDIHTGVGARINRVSFHTIDLEKGIGYRIKLKKEQ